MEVKRLDNNVTANLRSGYSVNNIPRCVNELVSLILKNVKTFIR